MSSYCLTCGQCFCKTCREYLSISQKATVSKPPVASSPKLKPPMPLNKSKCFKMVSPLHL